MSKHETFNLGTDDLLSEDPKVLTWIQSHDTTTE